MRRPKFVDQELGDLEAIYEERNLTVKTLRYIQHLEKKATQTETVVNTLTSRKQHWINEVRRLVIEKPDSDEAEDATHMYGVYIDVVNDMRAYLKEGH